MKAAGEDVKILSAGEPDFPTPTPILDEADRQLRAGATRYTPARGINPLVDAIVHKHERDQGITFDKTEVMSTVGTKGALSLAIDALVGEGDEVILFSPYWVTYPDLIRLAGGTPVVVETTVEEGWTPSADKLKAALTDKTKAVILCTPTNPTGKGIDKETLTAMMGHLEGTGVWVISDEIYERLTYGGFTHTSPAQISDDARARTLIVGGVAKAYAMTGWRLGTAAGPKPLIDAMILLQQQRNSCATAVSQAAAAYALKDPPEVKAAVDEMLAAYATRRDLVVELVRGIEGAQVVEPDGSFYCFVDVRGHLPGTKDGKRLETDLDLANALLEEAKVAVVPGTPFGAPGGFRISFATDEATLKDGIGRIRDFLGAIDRG